MTGPLHEVLKEGMMVHVKVDKRKKGLFFPENSHDQIGTIWELDDEHIWIEVILKNEDGESYVSGPWRYPWTDITIEGC